MNEVVRSKNDLANHFNVENRLRTSWHEDQISCRNSESIFSRSLIYFLDYFFSDYYFYYSHLSITT
jgi:hypothetical protein